jgi:hypothetical protein
VEYEATRWRTGLQKCLQRSHSAVVVMVPASKAITLFLRTLLVSPKLNSVGLPLAAREK